jgi:hypothetical protein
LRVGWQPTAISHQPSAIALFAFAHESLSLSVPRLVLLCDQQIKQIFKRLFRVYAHIYYSHFEKIVDLGEEAHLNTCFKVHNGPLLSGFA